MKKTGVLAILFIFLAAAAWGQTAYTWIGMGDIDVWGDPDNWLGSPPDPYIWDAGDDLIINIPPTGNPIPVTSYPSTFNVGMLTVTSGTFIFAGNFDGIVINMNGGTLDLDMGIIAPPKYIARLILSGTSTIDNGILNIDFLNVTGTFTLGGTAGTVFIGGGNVDVNSGNVEVTSAGNINLSGNIIANGNITIEASGTITLNASVAATAAGSSVTLGGAAGGNITLADSADIATLNGAITFSRPVTFNGNNTINSGNANITINDTVTLAANAYVDFIGTLNLTDDRTFNAPSGGIVRLSSIISAGSTRTLTLAGGSISDGTAIEMQSRSPAPPAPAAIGCNINIAIGSYAVLYIDSFFRQADGTSLTLGNNSTFDTSTGSWHIGGTAGSADNSFRGVNGSLNLGTNSSLRSTNLYLPGPSFSAVNTGQSFIRATSNVNITSPVFNISDVNFPQLVLEMAGTAGQSLTTLIPLGSLHVKNGSRTNLQNELEIYGEVWIDFPGVLNAGNYDITMYAGLDGTKNGSPAKIGRWRITGVDNYNPSINPDFNQAFLQSTSGTVDFRATSSADPVFFEIIGNTVWQIFKCEAAGAVIQFSTHPNQHVFYEKFIVKSTAGNNITLTRLPPAGSGWEYIVPPPLTPSGGGYPPAAAPRDLKTSPENIKFWNFNLLGTGSLLNPPLEIDCVTVFFSHAWSKRIPVLDGEIKAVPYYQRLEQSCFNYDWVRVRKIIYSFIEDKDGNGKADRIRVQASVPLNNRFDDFSVEIENHKGEKYTIDSTPGNFEWVYHITSDTDDESSFYININEDTDLYDGQPLKWRVKTNTFLRDSATQTQLIGDPADNEIFTTINTIPPRIKYAITLPGHNQTYIRMSQPVAPFASVFLPSGDDTFTGTEVDIEVNVTASAAANPRITERASLPAYVLEYRFEKYVQLYYLKDNKLPNTGALGYLVDLDSPPNLSQLASLPPIGTAPSVYFNFVSDLRDMGVRALDWKDEELDPDLWLYYPVPRYPMNWNYTRYKDFSGNSHIRGFPADSPPSDIFYPPNRVLTPEMTERLAAGGTVTPDQFDTDSNRRRITDVLVSLAPASPTGGGSNNYFAWPVWAMYEDTIRFPGTNTNPSDGFWGQQLTDTNIIWQFDGTRYLEISYDPMPVNDIQLQVRINNIINSIPGFTGLGLFYGIGKNIPVRFRNPAVPAQTGNGRGGLWLPGLESTNPRFNIVPFLNPHNTSKTSSPSSSPPLYRYELDPNEFSAGDKIEFVFKLNGISGADANLYVARLDAPPGAIPPNWYNLVRPFSFDIHALTYQRGGVTILNNVINPDNGEAAYIRYNLLRAGRVTVQVYTLDGTLVRSLRRNEHRNPGEYTDGWDGRNNGGRSVARGMYFIRVVGPDIDEIRKVMVVR